LKKAELAFIEEKIIIGDKRRWNAVSMWRRIALLMPSTTNSLEATHAHVNEAVSKRNPFWGSIAMFYNSIADKTLHFDAAFAHDFRTAQKRYRRRCQDVSAEQMSEECAYLGHQLNLGLVGKLSIYPPAIERISLAVIVLRWAL
jgi:hypothetical protein